MDNPKLAISESARACSVGSPGRTASPAPSPGEPRCMVVMYHYVHDHEPLASLGAGCDNSGVRGLTSDAFNAQLDDLCQVMEPIDWPTLYAWRCGRGSIPNRCFLLTFDDGLGDHAATVVPILERRSLRGVFFVPGEVLAGEGMLPAHAVHVLLSHMEDEALERELLDELARQDCGGVDWRAAVDPEAAQAMYWYESPVRAKLKYLLTLALPIELRAAVVNTLFERHIGSAVRWARQWYLGWEDLSRMQSSGHTIGAHGFRHEPLTRLSPAKQREDCRRIAALLRDGIGSDIRPFSYPFGVHDAETAAGCHEAGFVHAFTTEQQWVTSECDLLRLPRVDTIQINAVLEEEGACLSR